MRTTWPISSGSEAAHHATTDMYSRARALECPTGERRRYGPRHLDENGALGPAHHHCCLVLIKAACILSVA